MEQTQQEDTGLRPTTHAEAHTFNQLVTLVESRLKKWNYRAVSTDDHVRPGTKFLRVDIAVYLANATENDRPGQAEGTEVVSYNEEALTHEIVIQVHTHHFDKTGQNNQYRYFMEIYKKPG